MYAERRKFSISLATDGRSSDLILGGTWQRERAQRVNEFFQEYSRRLRRHRVRYWWRGELRAKALHDGIDRQ